METIKNTLFTNWNFMRFFRLGIGIFIAVEAIQTKEILAGIIAGLFIIQAITNTGCCGQNQCVIPNNKIKKDSENNSENEF